MLGSISEKRRGTSYRANHNSTLKIPSLNFNGETCFGSLTYPPPKKNIKCMHSKQTSFFADFQYFYFDNPYKNVCLHP